MQSLEVKFCLESKPGEFEASLISTVQKLQDIAVKLALHGTKNLEKLSYSQRNTALNWLPISQEIELSMAKMVHKIISNQIPAELADLMPLNKTAPRISIHQKLATKPSWLNRSQLTRSTFRNRAYSFNNLPGRITSLQDHPKFKKWAKVHKTNPQ